MSSPLREIARVAQQVGAEAMEVRDRPAGRGFLIRLRAPSAAAVRRISDAVPAGWDLQAMPDLAGEAGHATGWHQVTIAIPPEAMAEARDALLDVAVADDPDVPAVLTTDSGAVELLEPAPYDHLEWQTLNPTAGQLLALVAQRLDCETLEARGSFDTTSGRVDLSRPLGWRVVFAAPDADAALALGALVEAIGGSVEGVTPALAAGMPLPRLPVVAAILPPECGPFGG